MAVKIRITPQQDDLVRAHFEMYFALTQSCGAVNWMEWSYLLKETGLTHDQICSCCTACGLEGVEAAMRNFHAYVTVGKFDPDFSNGLSF